MTASLLDVDGAAAYLATSVRHVRALVYRRELTYVKVGRLVRFTTADLDAYVDARRVEASQDPGA